MDNNSKSAFMPSITYGFLMGIILVIYSLILYILELNENTWLGIVSYVITAVFLFYVITNFRDKQQNGFLSYGKGVSVGTLTGLFASVVLAIFIFIYVNYIDPSIVEKALVQAEEGILQRAPNISDEALEQQMSMVEIFTKPVFMAVTSIIWYTIVSLVFSLLISIFAKREDTNIA
ncbi:MAG: hypothetical protein C0598_14240 [Marinilabiliales bacterium]|nr:MAG: hypothetical protein C0598_14240 [Marinilabiliales bacterium]